MDWDAISTSAEVVGVAAVVGTLIYRVIQQPDRGITPTRLQLVE
jgi:hypothetical protein